MNVLVGCELSGTVRDAFIKEGHNAFSCDLEPSDVAGPHIQKDIYYPICHAEQFIASGYWDLIILHPPCTALAASGNAHYGPGKPKYKERVKAIRWTTNLFLVAQNNSKYVCMENPVGVLPSGKGEQLPKPVYIQPYDFGHDASKKTGLWLSGLPPLKATRRIKPRIFYGRPRWGNQTDSGQNKLGPSPDRAKKRSKTYSGVARAMANQWGNL